MLAYGTSVTVNTGFYSGQTGTVVKHALQFEGENTIDTYSVRLDVSPSDLSDYLPESALDT